MYRSFLSHQFDFAKVTWKKDLKYCAVSRLAVYVDEPVVGGIPKKRTKNLTAYNKKAKRRGMREIK
jgi:hypothetical protein